MSLTVLLPRVVMDWNILGSRETWILRYPECQRINREKQINGQCQGSAESLWNRKIFFQLFPPSFSVLGAQHCFCELQLYSQGSAQSRIPAAKVLWEQCRWPCWGCRTGWSLAISRGGSQTPLPVAHTVCTWTNWPQTVVTEGWKFSVPGCRLEVLLTQR